MNINWKMQHINNSCACACFAMLLSNFGIDKEDYEVIEESIIPYMIQYDEAENKFQAGMLVQHTDVFNSMSKKYGLEYVPLKCDNWQIYYDEVKKLIKQNIPFMTGISAKYIPSFGYDKVRRGNSKSNGHTIVVYGHSGSYFHIFDPSAGLDRKKEYQYEQVKKLVSINISEKRLKEGIEDKEGERFIIGYLKQTSSFELPDLVPYLETSRKSIFEFRNKMHNLQNILTDKNEKITYETFMEYIYRYIKPIALDFRNTIEVIRQKKAAQKKLFENLGKLQEIAISYQHELKAGINGNETFFDELISVSNAVYDLTIEHINNFNQ